MYDCKPRKLLVEGSSFHERLVIVTEHTNSTEWMVLYGESTIFNPLRDRPLEPNGPQVSSPAARGLKIILRLLILSQWGLVVGTVVLKDPDALFVTFWVLFCIFSHAYLIPARRSAKSWMRLNANINIQRSGTKLSSRRAFLNTIIVMNPDSFAWPASVQTEDRSRLDEGG